MDRIAVVIPCYRCSEHILEVLQGIPSDLTRIFVVDDACPEKTGDLVETSCKDTRVKVLRHSVNQGVGAAVVTGYKEALKEGLDIIVKIDGDGQMDPSVIPFITAPIRHRKADYTKGNRFYRLNDLKGMPLFRLIGNSALSFLTKFSTGYWHLMDPTNGFTAIHRKALENINLHQLEKRFFFESDMLFHLNLARAVVLDVPLPAKYGEEESNLKVHRILLPFLIKHIRRIGNRFFYTYIIRDFNLGTIEALGGLLFLSFGVIFGGYNWIKSGLTGNVATSGTVMLAGMSVILGIQLLIAATLYDMTGRPRVPLQEILDLT